MKGAPLWSVTTWDKRFNGVEKSWQKDVKKYNYLLADQLDSINLGEGPVRIIYTGKQVGYTSFELAGPAVSEGEIVAIPWGGIPRVQYFKGAFVTGDNRIATSSDTSILLNKYLYYWMLSRIELISSFYRGASLKHPSMRDVLAMNISIPSLEDQRRIAEELDSILSLKEDVTQQIPLLDEQVKSLFNECVSSNLYSKKPLRDLALPKVGLIRGPFGGALKVADFKPEGYLVYEQRHAIHSDFAYEKYYIDEEKFDRMKRFSVEPFDLLVSCSGTLGRISEVPAGAKPGIINQALLKIRLDGKVMLNRFFIEQFRNDEMQELLFKIKKGTGIPNLPSMNEMRTTPFICPPLLVQKELCLKFEQIDKLRFNCEFLL